VTSRFVESLSAKTFSEPPTIDQLSELFQDFYVKAAGHISTHISTLLLRLNRDSSRAASQKLGEDSANASDRVTQMQQMLTASEVSEKKKARRLLEYKRILLEEAVERRACEKVYEKIWRHKSTLDEVRDEKLRSKTAALALVGINLRDLGIELNPQSSKTAEDVQESLAPAREKLAKMNDENYPLGKLQHLTDAHKSIVDTLYTIHPSTSSADEILPTLIYSLVTSPIEGINIISNLNFIQRFRTASKIDGEAAYCLTNLEAAISFLENVDLASLREDEVPEGPQRHASKLETQTVEKLDPFPNFTASMPSSAVATTATSTAALSAATLHTPSLSVKNGAESPLPSPRNARTLSNLLQPSAKVFEAANDAVRNTAEEGFKNIGTTLDNSFKFLFGRLKERSGDDVGGEVIVPKTLDEARKLVSRPLTPDDETFVNELSTITDKEDVPPPLLKPEDKLLGLIGGRTPGSIRERSVDSVRSNGGSKKVAFAPTGPASELPLAQKATSNVSINPLDSVKNLGSSLNPLSHIGSALGGGFRSFSKAVSPSPLVLADRSKLSEPLFVTKSVAGETIKVEPALQKYVDLKDPADLRIKDVAELLQDYQRLAQVLKDLSQG
jgi:Vacuolar sorting protein 9 (VPS9) domain